MLQLIAHSVGTWIGYEFLQACTAAGVPPPRAIFLSAMPAPTIPHADRPWRQQRALNEEQFKEECKGWDISDVVFSAAMWPTYHPLLRADFTIFDEYEFTHKESDPIKAPLVVYWGTKDRRVKEHHVREWEKLVCGDFRCESIDGNHLFPMDKTAKVDWLGKIVSELDKLKLVG